MPGSGVVSGRIYLASSWRNPVQPALVDALREAGHGVYDFRNPPGGTGFGWPEVVPGWDIESQAMPVDEYLAALEHPRAIDGFKSDWGAMQWADTCILALPCGRSAHLELGWAVGAGKRTAIYLHPSESGHVVPELMYRMVDFLASTPAELIEWAGAIDRGRDAGGA